MERLMTIHEIAALLGLKPSGALAALRRTPRCKLYQYAPGGPIRVSPACFRTWLKRTGRTLAQTQEAA